MQPSATDRLNSTARLLLFGGLALIGLGLAYWFLSPKVYQSTATVRVEKRGSSLVDKLAIHPASSFETSDMTAEYRLLESDAFLNQVIANLHLRETWGKKFPPGTPLGTNEALLLLRTKADIRLRPKTTVFQIQVTGDGPDGLAPIANEIVRLYREHCQSLREASSTDRIATLRKQWEEQSERLRTAREDQEKVVRQIEDARSKAGLVYDPESFETMQQHRVELEAEYVRRQNQLAQLQALTPAQLRLVLPNVVSNDTLNQKIQELGDARRQLIETNSVVAPDSSDAKQAALKVHDLDQQVDEAVKKVMAGCATDVELRKSLLTQLDEKIRNASTNVDALSTNNPAYVAAADQVAVLERARDELQDKLISIDSVAAVSPLSLSAEVLQTAETPVQPSSPDKRVAFGMLGGGALAAVGGSLLGLLGRKRRVAPAQIPKPVTRPSTGWEGPKRM